MSRGSTQGRWYTGPHRAAKLGWRAIQLHLLASEDTPTEVHPHGGTRSTPFAQPQGTANRVQYALYLYLLYMGAPTHAFTRAHIGWARWF